MYYGKDKFFECIYYVMVFWWEFKGLLVIIDEFLCVFYLIGYDVFC